MIAKVMCGWRPAGLIRYLFGPGHAEEHCDPQVVASWDGAPRLHQPLPLPSVELDGEVAAAGPFDFDLRDLTAALEQPARRAGLPLSRPPRPAPEWEQRLRSGRPLPDEAPPTVRHYRRHPNTGEVARRQVLAEATTLITATTHRLRTGRGRDVDEASPTPPANSSPHSPAPGGRAPGCGHHRQTSWQGP